MALGADWLEPMTSSSADAEASRRAMTHVIGWLAGPLVKGDYPQEMKDTVARKSRERGEASSRLPEFTANQKSMLRGKDVLKYGVAMSHTLQLRVNCLYALEQACTPVSFSFVFMQEFFLFILYPSGYK